MPWAAAGSPECTEPSPGGARHEALVLAHSGVLEENRHPRPYLVKAPHGGHEVEGHVMQTRRQPGAAPRVAPALARPTKPQDAPSQGDDRGGGLLDYKAAALYLCTTTRHVRELWARRELAAIKVGRAVRFTKADLDAFIAANRVGAIR